MSRLFLLLILLHSPLLAAQLAVCPNLNSPMNERLAWARQMANQKSFWIGYSIRRMMEPDQFMISNVTIHGNFRSGDHDKTLQEWIHGTKPDHPADARAAAQLELDRLEHKSRAKIWKELGIFQLFRRGSAMPEKTCVIDMSVKYSFEEPLYWIDSASLQESFQYLTGQYQKVQSVDEKSELVGAISIHPPDLAFPFFKQVLKGSETEEVQKSAAVFAGEIDTPEALALLKDVALTNSSNEVRQSAVVGISDMSSVDATKELGAIAFSNQDQELRSTAMAMLADRNNQEALQTLEKIAWFDPDAEMRSSAIAIMSEMKDAVPVLLKIVDDHPSKQTREVALQMLAETVAGREVLKEKISH